MKELTYLVKDIKDSNDLFWFKFLEYINRNKFVVEDTLDTIFEQFNFNCDICVLESTRDFEHFKSIYKNSLEIDENLWMLLKRNTLISVAKKNQLQNVSINKKVNDTVIKESYYVHPIITNESIYYIVFNKFDGNNKHKYALAFEAAFCLFQTCEKNSLLSQYTMVDSITGCYNFNQFQKALGAEIAKVDRIDDKDIVFSIILMDIDGFDKLNEKYGYTCGDLILKKLAKRIQKKIRTTDDAYRIGGDEFCIINTYATKEVCSETIFPRIKEELTKKIAITETEFYTPQVNVAIVQYKKGISRAEFEKIMEESIQKAKETGTIVVI